MTAMTRTVEETWRESDELLPEVAEEPAQTCRRGESREEEFSGGKAGKGHSGPRGQHRQ